MHTATLWQDFLAKFPTCFRPEDYCELWASLNLYWLIFNWKLPCSSVLCTIFCGLSYVLQTVLSIQGITSMPSNKVISVLGGKMAPACKILIVMITPWMWGVCQWFGLETDSTALLFPLGCWLGVWFVGKFVCSFSPMAYLVQKEETFYLLE